MRNKKAQEEIVGFVLVIVLVSVVFLILIGILLRQHTPIESKSTEYTQFLSAMMEYTSNCVVYSPAYAKVGDLIGYCIDDQKCLSGKISCSVLNSTISDILNTSILVGSERAIKGYEFSIDYNNTKLVKPIMNIRKGVCNITTISAESLLPHSPGSVTTTLKICY